MSATLYCTRCLTTFVEDSAQCPNLGCRGARPASGWPKLLSAGQLLDRHYRILRVIAGGAAGMTYLAREVDQDGADMLPDLAIKVLYQQRDSGPFLRRLANEAQILQELDSEHIVQCLGFVHRRGHAPYLITRFEPGGTLQHHIHRVGTLPVTVAAAVILQIVQGLDVAHQSDIVHRDLKPGNVLLRAEVAVNEVPNIKIADFGIAKVTGSLGGLTRIGAFVGTPEYAAPEQFLGEDPSGATDLFAAGGMLWFLLTGRPPVALSQRHDPIFSYKELLEQIPPRLPAQYVQSGGHAIQTVIDNLMQPLAADRWNAERVCAELRQIMRATDHAAPAPLPVHPQLGAGGTILMDDFDDDDFVEPPRPSTPSAPPPAAATPKRQVPTPSVPARPERQVSTPAEAESTMEALFAFTEPEPAPRSRSVLGWQDLDDEPAPRPALATGFSEQAFEGGGQAQLIIEAEVEELDDLIPGLTPDVPDDLPGLLGALASWRPSRRQPLVQALSRVEPHELNAYIRRAKSDEDPHQRQGAALAVGLLGRTDQSSMLRSLLRDKQTDVRAAAVTALGLTAAGSALPQLARCLQDTEPKVRAAAAIAVAEAYVRDGDRRRARHHLDLLTNDRNPVVREAWRKALTLLEHR